MAYDEELAQRIRDELLGEPGLSEKKMFGGLGFMINGNMACAAASRGGLMIRIAPGTGAEVMNEHVQPMEMRGKPMGGWILAEPPGFRDDDAFERLVVLGRDYARSLPPKQK